MTKKEKVTIATLIGYAKIAKKYIPSNLEGYKEMLEETIKEAEKFLK